MCGRLGGIAGLDTKAPVICDSEKFSKTVKQP